MAQWIVTEVVDYGYIEAETEEEAIQQIIDDENRDDRVIAVKQRYAVVTY